MPPAPGPARAGRWYQSHAASATALPTLPPAAAGTYSRVTKCTTVACESDVNSHDHDSWGLSRPCAKMRNSSRSQARKGPFDVTSGFSVFSSSRLALRVKRKFQLRGKTRMAALASAAAPLALHPSTLWRDLNWLLHPSMLADMWAACVQHQGRPEPGVGVSLSPGL